MKKTMIALAALGAAAAAHAQSGGSSVQIYGIVDAGITHITNTGGDSRTGLDSGIASSSRLGFRGTEDLGGGWSAGFRLESAVDVAKGDVGRGGSFFNRESTLILTSPNMGLLKIGRQLDFLNEDGGVPDAAPIILGGAAAGYAGFGRPFGIPGAPRVDVRYGGYQSNNTIKWMHKFGAIGVGYMYGFGTENAQDRNHMQSAMVNYLNGPVSVGLAWAKDNYSGAPWARETIALKGMYVTGPWMLLANYAYGKDSESPARIKPLDVTVAYNVTPQWRIGGGFGYAKATNEQGVKATLTQPYIGTKYFLSKRTHVYAMATRNHTSDKSAVPASLSTPGGAIWGVSSSDSMTAVRVGVSHRF